MTPSLSLKNWEYVLYPLDHPSASYTWDTTEGAITEKVGACLQSIRPLSSIWYLSYHCKGWGMCSICQATREHLILGLSLKKLLGYPLCALSVYPLAHRSLVSTWHLGYHCKFWGMCAIRWAICRHPTWAITANVDWYLLSL